MHKRASFQFLLPVLFAIGTGLCLAAAGAAQSDKSDYFKGLDLYHAGNYEAAAEAFESQVQKTPEDGSAKKWLELARKRAGQEQPAAVSVPAPAPAVEAVTRAAAPEPPPAPAVVNTTVAMIDDDYEKGISLYIAGNYDEARRSFNRYLEANPGHEATQEWIALIGALEDTEKPAPAAPAKAQARPVDTGAAQKAAPTETSRREKELAAEVEQLRRDLKNSEDIAARAVEQTKKALQLPPTPQGSGEITKLKSDLERSEAARASAEKQLADTQGRLRELEETQRRLLEDMKKSGVELADARSELKNSQAELAHVRKDAADKISAAEKASATSAQSVSEMKARYQEAETAQADAEKQLGAFERRVDEQARELAEIRSSSERWAAQLDAKDSELAETKGNLAQALKLLEESRAQGLKLVTESQRERAGRAEEATQWAARIADTDARMAALKDHLNSTLLDMQKERQRHEEAQAQWAARETTLNSRIEAMKKQLAAAIPQLEAMRVSLDEFGADAASADEDSENPKADRSDSGRFRFLPGNR